MKKPKRWWISWRQPGEDYRPTAWPMPASILGYWCSGQEGGGEERHTLCAAVEGTEAEARATLAACWPEFAAAEERFCEERPGDWNPYSERFPRPKWRPSVKPEFLPGVHLALDRARRFLHPIDKAFTVTTRRVVVVADDGREVVVRPVDEKSGDVVRVVKDAEEATYYSFDRAQGPLPIKGRWMPALATTHCYSCKGTGQREPWIPGPMTKHELAALSRLLEPWCPKTCEGRESMKHGWCYTNVTYDLGDGNWERFNLVVCPHCGQLRRNRGAVTLRECYRAPLALVGEQPDPDEANAEATP